MKGLIALLCLVAATPAFAGAYRWVDENGQTHFGDRPPSHATSKEIQLDSTPPEVDTAAHERKRQMNEFLEQTEKERAERNAARAQQEARAARQQAHCESLQARLKYLNRVSGIYHLNSEGERVFVDDEENERIRREFRARVREECGG